jgi:hypothetical protein
VMNQLGFLGVHDVLRADSTLALSRFYTLLHKWDAPAVSSRKHDRDDRGFLDECLKYYDAYIPLPEEAPSPYNDAWNSDFQNSTVERMDIMFVPSNWRYFDRNVPKKIL